MLARDDAEVIPITSSPIAMLLIDCDFSPTKAVIRPRGGGKAQIFAYLLQFIACMDNTTEVTTMLSEVTIT
jgi:hypothetical protein